MTGKRSRRRTASQWREVLQRFEQSGQSGRQFCNREGIALKSFYRAKSKYGSPIRGDNSPFVPVKSVAVTDHPTPRIHIDLPLGRIELPPTVSARWVAELFRALSA